MVLLVFVGGNMRFATTLFLIFFTLSDVFADNQSEPNYSKFQSNYFFTCPEPMACVAAFEKMLAAPEIAAKGYEVSLMA